MIKQSNISGVILAAGSSSRMKDLKPLLPFRGKPLLEGIIATALHSELDRIVVVLGHEADRIVRKIDFSGVGLVINENFGAGQSSSMQVGLKEVRADSRAVVFLLADQPLISVETINHLIRSYRHSPADIIAPGSAERKGNPVLFSRSLFPEIMKISGDRGGRALFSMFRETIRYLELSKDSLFFDLDTPEDYEKLIKDYGDED